MHATLPPLFALILTGGASFAQAAPIVFTSTHYTTFAQVDAGDASSGPFFDASNAAMLPFSSAADAVGDNGDSGSAVSFADTLFLTTTSEASALSTSAASTASATFTGTFDALPGLLNLTLDFDTFIDQLAGGFASNLLAVTLEIGGVALFDNVLFDTASIDQSFLLTSSGAGLFDLTLISTADAAAAGDYAFSLASVNASLDLDAVAVAVPEPASAALLLAGLLGIGFARQRMAGRHPPTRAI